MAAAPKKGTNKDDLASRFDAACAAAKQTKKKPDNATLLKLYSYYKQATEGDVSGARPGGFDFVGGAKYDAWAKLKGTSREGALFFVRRRRWCSAASRAPACRAGAPPKLITIKKWREFAKC